MSTNCAGLYFARASLNARADDAHRSSCVSPMTGPWNTVDQVLAVSCDSEHDDAIETTGSRWVCTMRASGYTVMIASSADRCDGFLSTQRLSWSFRPISC